MLTSSKLFSLHPRQRAGFVLVLDKMLLCSAVYFLIKYNTVLLRCSRKKNINAMRKKINAMQQGTLLVLPKERKTRAELLQVFYAKHQSEATGYTGCVWFVKLPHAS